MRELGDNMTPPPLLHLRRVLAHEENGKSEWNIQRLRKDVWSSMCERLRPNRITIRVELVTALKFVDMPCDTSLTKKEGV